MSNIQYLPHLTFKNSHAIIEENPLKSKFRFKGPPPTRFHHTFNFKYLWEVKPIIMDLYSLGEFIKDFKDSRGFILNKGDDLSLWTWLTPLKVFLRLLEEANVRDVYFKHSPESVVKLFADFHPLYDIDVKLTLIEYYPSKSLNPLKR